MSEKSDTPSVLLLLAVMAVAIVLVDDRWVRVGLGLVPGLLLTQRALLRPSTARAPEVVDDRRQNQGLREQIQELLKLIREFYTTCHMVAVGQLAPAKAKTKAQEVERRLNAMMAEMLERIEGVEGVEAPEGTE